MKERSSASPVAGTAFGTLTLNVKPSLAVFEVPDPSSTFSINVKTLTGKILPFEIHSLTTCEQLKVAIEYREGVPKDQQRVIFGGKQVTDGESVTTKRNFIMLMGLCSDRAKSTWDCRG